jgi:hypothetical protein
MMRSHTSEGFRLIFRQPVFGLTEIAWRWTIGAAAIFLVTAGVLEFLDSLPVNSTDLLLLRLRHPIFVSQAIAHIFHGNAPRVVAGIVVLGLALTVAWMVVSALGRAATLEGMLAYFRQEYVRDESMTVSHSPWRLRSLVGLNFLRAAAALAALAGLAGAILLAYLASPEKAPSPGLAMLVFFAVLAMTAWIWSTLNWLLSLASLFVVRQGENTWGSISAAVSLCRNRLGTVAAPGTWFGLVHFTLFLGATTVVTFPMAFAGVLPSIVVLAGMLFITLAYFAFVDFLYVGRLAAYVSILERPEPLPVPVLPPTRPEDNPALVASSSIDQDELILSDIPPSPEPTV